MRDDLLFYYERELTYLRRMGAEFGQRYPKIASRLRLEPSKCDDPHVERLLEGFAFLAARVHLKIDDDFPEVSEAILNVVYPHYTRPVPSMSIVEFELDPDQGKLNAGYPIPRDTLLYALPVQDVRCRFRTCFDTTLWPLDVKAVEWRTPDQLGLRSTNPNVVGAIRLELQCFDDVALDQLELSTLRLHLNGEGALVSALYELLDNNCVEILARDPSNPKRRPVPLPLSALAPAGFNPDEGMLPYVRRSLLPFRLLQEYFTFPAKFMFFDLSGFDTLREAGFTDRVEFVFLISAFERVDRKQMLTSQISERTVRLGCSPIVNLFQEHSEPILVTQRKYEYPLRPDVRTRAEWTGIFSVDQVTGITPGDSKPTVFEPLYSHRHGSAEHDVPFWTTRRVPNSLRSDEADILISFVDQSVRSVKPPFDTVAARLTCFNGSLPSRLPVSDEAGVFELPGGGPIRRILTLVQPTPVVQAPLGKSRLWRLISQLSLNYVSLLEGEGKRRVDTLRELLTVHNWDESASGDRHIQGIVGLDGGPCHSHIETELGLSFARGQRIEIEFDEEQFVGSGVYLFASVLEHFFGTLASLNSFCVLAAKTRQRKEMLRQWPPRAGLKALV